MYSPVSDIWDFALRDNGKRICRADLFYANDTTPVIMNMPVSRYSVTTDRRAANRRSGTATIVSQELLDILRTSPGTSSLEPYGSEIKLYAGVVHSNGTTELVPLGIFQIEQLSWDEPGPEIVLTLVDRSSVWKRYAQPYAYDASGEGAINFIARQYTVLMPWVDFTIDPRIVDVVLPGGTSYQGDYLTFMGKVAETLGAEMYFDVDGDAHLVPVPVLDATILPGQADWIINAGDHGVLMSANPSVSRTDIKNRVTIGGAATEGKIGPWCRAEDLDPNSPTYVYGPFGVVDYAELRQELTTIDQCRVMAYAILANSTGLSQTLTLKSLYNPALQESDYILVVFPDGREEMHLVDKITFDHSGTMTIDTRSQVRRSSV